MKKILFFLVVLTVILVSCQDKNAFTISGTLENDKFEGKTVYLQRIDSIRSQSPTVTDSAVIKDKKFTIKGSTVENEITLGVVSVGKLETLSEESPVATVILEPGAINVTFKENGDVNIGGTERNEGYNKVLIVMNDIAALYKEVSDAGGPNNVQPDSDGKNANDRLEDLQKRMREASFDFAKANMVNKAGQLMFFSAAGSFTKEQLGELVAAGDSTFKSLPEIAMLQEELNRVVPEVGQPFADVRLVNKEGSPVLLSEYAGKNKCVLIDFWASWCKPCIEEMPHLRKIYSSYKGKGLEIIGISVDDDKAAWLDAVNKNSMNWIQLADDQKLAGEIYAVTSIPHTVLVDANGTIVAKNLRGQELEDKIAEMLK
ncbi:MAG: AhpC/TSA family protein [Prevotella sp.]|jgi:peroxiredoxin|nr:AhpC/TSA family protein [Prevotella sp.]